MSEDRMIAVVGLLMVLILIGTGLAQRRLGPRRWLTLGGVWLLIFLMLWAIAALVQHYTQTGFT